LLSVLNLIECGLKDGQRIKLELYSSTSKRKSTLIFPSLKLQNNKKFAIYFYLLRLIYNQIELNEIISKRQIYYMNVSLFKQQSIVDSCIDKIADCLGLSIEQLRIAASQKGLIYADLIVNDLHDKCRIIKISRDNGPSLIPLISLSSKPSDFNFIFNNNPLCIPISIIILEKDAILSSLINTQQNKLNFKNTILISGRGFPDRLTKHFIWILSESFKSVPIYGYFDADIYGSLIAFEYKYKNFNTFNNPPCSNLQIRGAKLFPFNFDKTHSLSYLIPLNNRDILVAISRFQSLIKNVEILREMQRSLFLQVKRELQLTDIAID
jgi:meiotic recombination protein SPO11